jgi:hypothetical protein
MAFELSLWFRLELRLDVVFRRTDVPSVLELVLSGTTVFGILPKSHRTKWARFGYAPVSYAVRFSGLGTLAHAGLSFLHRAPCFLFLSSLDLLS